MAWAWRAEFTAVYLEDITRKTGKPMSYEQFLSTLIHSLAAQDPNAFVDLLNVHDLQLLKGQKTGKKPEPSNPHDAQPQKKYLIMTKIDRESKQKVHYPLPLMPLDTDKPHTLDPATIKLMIAKMARSMTNLH